MQTQTTNTANFPTFDSQGLPVTPLEWLEQEAENTNAEANELEAEPTTAERIEYIAQLRAESERLWAQYDALNKQWAQEIICGQCCAIWSPEVTDSRSCPECGHEVQSPEAEVLPRRQFARYSSLEALVEAKAQAQHAANLSTGGVFDENNERTSNIDAERRWAAKKVTRLLGHYIEAEKGAPVGFIGWCINGFGYAPLTPDTTN